MNGKIDRRYGTPRWKRTRRGVLVRDLWRCQVAPGCLVTATVADHIVPVYDGMPDWQFFGMVNLRASCRHHNRRGHVERFQAETSGGPTTGT